MYTETDKRVDLDAIKKMARNAAKKASKHQTSQVTGVSTVVISYDTNERASQHEKKNIRNFFSENKKKST